ncbi:MAG: hypothetical protein LUF04_15620 [Bacteroides sp.]|nr:hypothetical protein [Bacteroides sp.]
MKKILFTLVMAVCCLHLFAHSENGESGQATNLLESEIVKEGGLSFQIKNIDLNQYNTLQGYDVVCINESGKAVDIEFHSYV